MSTFVPPHTPVSAHAVSALARRLPPATQASVLAIQSARSVSDIEALDTIRVLLQVGAKQRVIVDVTGFSARVIRGWHDRDSPIGSVGRPASSLRGIMRDPKTHAAVSYAARGYYQLLRSGIYPAPPEGGYCPRSFVRALIATASMYLVDQNIVDHLWVVLGHVRDGLLCIVHCRKCDSDYVGSHADARKLGLAAADLDCPTCRTRVKFRAPPAAVDGGEKGVLALRDVLGNMPRARKRPTRAKKQPQHSGEPAPDSAPPAD